jgi:hypothetical protein
MAGHGEKLSRKQEAFIAALLTQPTILQAAQAAGISEATATRWLKEPGVATAYAAARRAALGEAMAFVQQSMLSAVLTLRHVMLAAETPAPSKVTAAKTILDMGLRSFELEELEQRIAALEAARGQG